MGLINRLERYTTTPFIDAHIGRWWRYRLAAYILGLAGIFVAGTLSLSHVWHAPLPCGVGSGCQTILNHPSSSVLGVPVAVYGLFAYGLISTLLGVQLFRGRLGTPDTLAYLLAGFGAVVSLTMTAYSVGVVRQVCTWCLASAVIMCLLLFCMGRYHYLSAISSDFTGQNRGGAETSRECVYCYRSSSHSAGCPRMASLHSPPWG